MKRPAKDRDSIFSDFDQSNLEEVPFHELEESGLPTCDLHDENFTMMLEIYGSDFQKVWKKTRKKWWA